MTRVLADALLSGLPEHDGAHKKYSLQEVFLVFLWAVLQREVGSPERAYEARELEYLKRIQGRSVHKQNPDGDTVLKRLKGLLPWQEFRDLVVEVLRGSVRFACRHTGHLDGAVDVAFDGHKIPIYPRKGRVRRRTKALGLEAKERLEFERDDYRRDAVGAHGFRGTKQALSYATLQTTSPHRYTLAFAAMADHANRFHRALDACLAEVESLGVRVGTVYIDREGSTGKVAGVLAKAVALGWIRYFLVAARRDGRVERALDGVAWRDVPYRLACEYKVVQELEMGPGARASLVAVRRWVDKRGKPSHVNDPMKEQRTFVFWTNREVLESNVYALSEEYRKRWGIETGYREDRYGFPRTKSESRKIRRLTYIVSLVALNLRQALDDASLRACMLEIPFNRAASLARVKAVLLRAIEHRLEAPK